MCFTRGALVLGRLKLHSCEDEVLAAARNGVRLVNGDGAPAAAQFGVRLCGRDAVLAIVEVGVRLLLQDVHLRNLHGSERFFFRQQRAS